MYKFFVNKSQINNDTIEITNNDVNHIKNVLRLSINDEIEVANLDDGMCFLCKITQMTNETILCKIIAKITNSVEPNIHLHILQGLPKSDKMELIIQKCTELGAKEFTPVALKRCIVQLSGKDETKKIERWQKIAEVAAKQSKRDIIPKINDIANLAKIRDLIKDYDIFIVAYEEENENGIKKILKNIEHKENLKVAVLIGPEGGIESSEIELLKQNGAIIVSLGNRTLRTETAPIVLATIIMYELNQM